MTNELQLPGNYRPERRRAYLHERAPARIPLGASCSPGVNCSPRAQSTIDAMREAPTDGADEADRASRETPASSCARAIATASRNKIESALKRIADGSYGYCDEYRRGNRSGFGFEARPIATLTVEAQALTSALN